MLRAGMSRERAKWRVDIGILILGEWGRRNQVGCVGRLPQWQCVELI
jgi:hypothetical protein